MIFGQGAIYEASNAGVEFIEQGEIISLSGTAANFSFSSYAEDDEFVVIAAARKTGVGTSENPTVSGTGWTTAETDDQSGVGGLRIWHRTLGSSENPNSYDFDTVNSGAAIFFGFIIRGASNFVSGFQYTESDGTEVAAATVSGMSGSPVVCGATFNMSNATTFVGINPAAYADMSNSGDTGGGFGAKIAGEGGSNQISASSETIDTDTLANKVLAYAAAFGAY